MICFLIGAIPLMLGSFPATVEQYIHLMLDLFPALRGWETKVSTSAMLGISFLGMIVFVLATIGKFQEHSIRLESVGICRRQINLLRYFSYMSIGYVVCCVMILIIETYFSDPIVKQFTLALTNALCLSTTLFLCYCIVKVYVFEEILDHYELDRALQDIVVTIPGFQNISIKRSKD